MFLDNNLKVRITCKRTSKIGGLPCNGQLYFAPSELERKTGWIPECPNCQRSFSEGRTVFLNGEIIRTLAQLLNAAIGWNTQRGAKFTIELVEANTGDYPDALEGVS